MKNVALALASGGPRGFAFIGAIEVLQERGYHITSVAGASAGSLVGGIFAAGGLDAFKEWLYGMDAIKVMSLMDFGVSKNYLVKGERVMDAIRERVPEVDIEDLPIPFAAVATDLHTGEEVVFREGPLFEAIRASISIPSMFRPVKWKGRTLVDGGMVNTFPLNRVERTPGDILVGFNVNQIDADGVRAGRVRERGEDNFKTILQRSFGIMNGTIARMGIALCPPDILIDLPFDSYHGVYGYSHAPEIVEVGRRLTAEALDRYENEAPGAPPADPSGA